MWYVASLCCLLFILAVLSSIGTAVVDLCLPQRLRLQAREFLTPILGLGLLLIPVTVLGWFGDGFRWWICLPVTLTMAVAGWLLSLHRRGRGPEVRTMWRLAGFTALTSFPILGQLLRYNVYSPFSDVWVYLCQAQWLQRHGFHEHPALSAHHPIAVSIAHWQWGGLRISPSFLLGWLQATFGLDWSYQIYPTTLSVAMICGALAVGGTVRAVWPNQRQAAWWSALAAGTTLNGFVCGAAFGFLPQTFGLSFATAAVALRGMEMSVRRPAPVTNAANNWGAFVGSLRAVVPISLCLSATLYCYPEVCPFLAVTMAISYLLPLPNSVAQWRSRAASLGCVALVSATLVSPEAGRAVRAMQNQASVVTGFPVAWSSGGFLAHSLGVKSGPAEGGKWFYKGVWANLMFGAPVVICFLLLLVWVARARSSNYAETRSVPRPVCRWLALVPTIGLAAVCAAASLYFRWFVPNPWPQAIGSVGQTFSQYKLALWASPALLTIATATVIRLTGRWRVILIGGLAVWCAQGIGAINGMLLTWVDPILQASGERQDPFGSYRAFCETLWARPASESFYLPAAADDLYAIRQRQLLVYFLADRELLGNWLVGGFIPLRQMGVENHDSIEEADWVVRYHPADSAEKEASPRLCRLTVERPRQDRWSGPKVTGGYNLELAPDGRRFFWTAHELQMVWHRHAAEDGDAPGGIQESPARMRLNFAVRSLASLQSVTVRITEGGKPVTTLPVSADVKEKAIASEPFVVVGDEVAVIFTGSAAPVRASASDARELSYQVIAPALEAVRD